MFLSKEPYDRWKMSMSENSYYVVLISTNEPSLQCGMADAILTSPAMYFCLDRRAS